MIRACLVVAALLFLGGGAEAVELGAPDKWYSLELHGFVSQGFLYSTDNNYLAKSSRGSFEFNEVGLNVTKGIVDRLRAGMQLFMRDLGPIGNYTVKVDWFYLDYRWKDWLGFRAGRVKLPFGLYNDAADIDAARAPVLLPQSMYPTTSRDYLLAQTGVEVYGYIPLGRGGAFDYRLYAGTVFAEPTEQPSGPITLRELDIRYVIGGRLLWESPVDGLRLGGSVQSLQIDAKFASAFSTRISSVSVRALMWVASLEYAAHRMQLALEYSRWHASASTDDGLLLPPGVSPDVVTERAYGLFAFRATRWFQPGAYYALLYPDVEKRKGRENQQHDLSVFLRFDINPYWIFKLEGHYMWGTAYLTPSLNDFQPLSVLPRQWGFFLAKTTVYF